MTDQPLGKCTFILSTTGQKCTNEVWGEEEPFCLFHDIWQCTLGRQLEATLERDWHWQSFESVDDATLLQVLEDRYGKRADLHVFVSWIRETVALNTPATLAQARSAGENTILL